MFQLPTKFFIRYVKDVTLEKNRPLRLWKDLLWDVSIWASCDQTRASLTGETDGVEEAKSLRDIS